MDGNQAVLLGFVERLFSASDIDAMFEALEQAAIQLGFEHVSFTYIPDFLNRQLNNLAPVFKLSQHYPVEFINQYAACNFGQHDFTIKKITRGDMATVRWWEMARQLAPQEKYVIEVARQDYGLRHGITIPVFSEAGAIAGISVTCSEADQLFDRLCQERIATLTQIARMFSDRALQLPRHRAAFYRPFLERLSSTEKAVLSRLAQSHNLKTISRDLQLDYKYLANTVIASLRRKFGNVTRDKLMYEAGRIEFDKLVDHAQKS